MTGIPMTLIPILEKIVSQDHVGCAYIFFGSHSQAQKTQAILFAKKLNCPLFPPSPTRGEGEKLCQCQSCKKIDRSTHPDVYELKDEESLKIDRLREIQAQLHLKPYEGKWKVVIIANAQELSLASSNSLLKILEEPPSNTVFLLLTTHCENVLPTILSRCQPVRISETLEISLSKPDYLTDLLSLPAKPDQILDLAKKVAQDEEELKNTLEILLTWYHDMLFYKKGLNPFHSPLKEKETLGKNMCQKFSIQQLNQKLQAILEAKKALHFQVNRELLTENLFLQLAQ